MKLKVFILILITFFDLQATLTQQVFTAIYDNAVWGKNNEGEGWSGIGSSLEATIGYREFITEFLFSHSIKSVVDLGCGDWEFSRYIDWTGIDYLGIDVVASVIEKNLVRYKKTTINFEHLDALESNLPCADLLICKEVLQHLTNANIHQIISQFKKYKYCLITNGVDYTTLASDNYDISCGEYRPIDLTMPPFNIEGIKILTFYSAGFYKQTLLITN